MEGFLSTEGGNEKLRVDFRQGHLLGEDRGLIRQITPQTLIRKFLTDWVKIPLLAEAKLQLGYLLSFGLVMGLNKSDSSLACLCFLTMGRHTECLSQSLGIMLST